jgi:hypothetical protein
MHDCEKRFLYAAKRHGSDEGASRPQAPANSTPRDRFQERAEQSKLDKTEREGGVVVMKWLNGQGLGGLPRPCAACSRTSCGGARTPR